MMPDDEPSLRQWLHTEEVQEDDPGFVMRTHRVVAVEALAHLERRRAWRACARDLAIAAAMVGGMVASALWVLHGVGDAALVWPLVLSIAAWAVLHDRSMPQVTMGGDDPSA